MNTRFSIANWSAWAPGITDEAAWRRWFANPCMPAPDDDNFTLESTATTGHAAAEGAWAPDLMALRFLVSGEPKREHVTALRTWRWQRHAGVG